MKWDYNACYELAKQCVKKSEMKSKNQRAYIVALRNGWFSDYTWFLSDDVIRHQKRPSRVKWSYERCKELALQYNKLIDFSKAYPSAYTISNRNGWIDDFDWLCRSDNAYTSKIDNVYGYFFYEFNSVYIGRTIKPSDRDICHNINEKSTVFRFASYNNTTIPKMTILESNLTLTEGLVKEDYYINKYKNEGWNVLNIAKTGKRSGSLGRLGYGKWTYNSCYNEAKKYDTMKDFRTKSASAYNVSCKNNWIDDYVWLKIKKHKRGFWTYENCYNEAKKYKTRIDFQRGSGSAYDKALRENWIDDYFWFSIPSNKLKWTYETCYNEAKKYTKLSDFINNCACAYNKARRNGWIKDYVWLYKKDISKKIVLQFTLDGDLVAEYEGAREACRKNGFKSSSGIIQCCNGKLKTHKGFLWMYYDDYKEKFGYIPLF